MKTLVQEILDANGRYADTFDKGSLPMPPARKLSVLTCMDARLDPAKFAGLSEGDAHVIRDAGGRASDDAIRSLVISHKLLGTTTWVVIHHTGCGMQTFTSEVMGDLLSSSLHTARLDAGRWKNAEGGPGSSEGKYINWLTIDNQEQSLLEDVQRIRNHPLVPRDLPIYGFIYDCGSGRLSEVPQATAAGQPR